MVEQYRDMELKTLETKSGKRVIVDPTITITRIFMFFYFMVTLGNLIARFAMESAANKVGSW